jgi:uncharacterized protein
MLKHPFLTLFFLVCFIIVSASFTLANASNIVWGSYSDAVFTQAKNQHRLVLLFVKSDSCPWCRKQTNITFNNAAVIQAVNANYLAVKVDVDKERSIAERYSVSDLPTVLILDANHHVVNTLSGYNPPLDMIHFLKAPTTQ